MSVPHVHMTPFKYHLSAGDRPTRHKLLGTVVAPPTPPADRRLRVQLGGIDATSVGRAVVQSPADHLGWACRTGQQRESRGCCEAKWCRGRTMRPPIQTVPTIPKKITKKMTTQGQHTRIAILFRSKSHPAPHAGS